MAGSPLPTPSTSLAEEESVAAAAASSASSSSSSPATEVHRTSALASHSVPSPRYISSATFLSAGMANVVSAICTNPADVLKVRQQLLLSRTRASFASIALTMVRKDGVRSLWSGVTASMLREGTYSTIRMGGYEPFKRLYARQLGFNADSFANKVLAGVSSGAIGAAITTPTDLMKVRMQSARPDGRPPYPTTFHGFAQVYQGGGIRALWRGVWPNTIRAAVLTSSQIATYDEVKVWLKGGSLTMQEGMKLHLTASTIAGFVCSAASQPIDVLKTRLMSLSKAPAHVSRPKALTILADLLRNEGPMALWKGFGMCWARLGSHTVISLTLFEGFRGLLGVKPL